MKNKKINEYIKKNGSIINWKSAIEAANILKEADKNE